MVAGSTSLFIVDLDAPEAQDKVYIRKVGLGEASKIAGTSFIEYDDVVVPRANLIGKENAGFLMMMQNLNHERLYLSTICNRMARICVEESYKFALKRKTFGKPLIQHDIIKQLLAKCSSRVEQQHAWLESLYYQLKSMSPKEADAKLGAIVCGLKAQSSEVLEECASMSTHVFGGNALDSSSAGRRIKPPLLCRLQPL
jgi:alkylation response protein AidB-like acyl-CoA dehydrogenase